MASPGGAGPTTPPAIVTPSAAVVGKVISVDVPGRFVVLGFPLGQLPEAQRRFHLYRHGLKVGEVRIGGPQSGENTVADLVAGDAAAGDEARPE